MKVMQETANIRRSLKNFSAKCVVKDVNGVRCDNKSINSHSVQHNGILSNLAEKGHLYFIGNDIGEERFDYEFKRIGINKASTFRCLCAEHDKKLFIDIEDRSFNGESKQYFQFALKALLKGYYSKLISVYSIPDSLKKVQEEVQLRNDMNAFEEELSLFWEIYNCNKYEDILNWKVTIPRKISFAASFAVNVLRKFDGTLFGKENSEYPLLCVSVFPQNDSRSLLIVSTHIRNREYFNSFISQFNLFSTDAILRRFNILIPLLSEDIYFAPSLVEHLLEEEVEDIKCVFSMLTLSLYNTVGFDIDKLSQIVKYDLFK